MVSETPARAQALVRTIRDVLHPVELLLRQHPYVQALEEGRLLPSQLRSFVGEQSSIIPSDLRSIALLISRCAASASQQFFRAVLDGEVAALEALESLATAVGMAPADRDAHEPTRLCTKSRFLAIFYGQKWVYMVSKNRQNETKKFLLTCKSDF